jgi:phage shock protein A
MLKTLITLVRGHTSAAESAIVDRNALLILDQQLRDASAALERAKRALAIAIAQDQQEATRLAAIETQITDLEPRVLAALEAGRDDLARDGAETIARLEADRDAARSARALFAAQIARLRQHVSEAGSRIAAVDRGRRIARAAEAVRDMRRGRIETAMPHQATLAEAEATLQRLSELQSVAATAEEALDAIDAATAPATAAERLAAEGFGAPLRTSADDVIARLKARGAGSKPAA